MKTVLWLLIISGGLAITACHQQQDKAPSSKESVLKESTAGTGDFPRFNTQPLKKNR